MNDINQISVDDASLGGKPIHDITQISIGYLGNSC